MVGRRLCSVVFLIVCAISLVIGQIGVTADVPWVEQQLDQMTLREKIAQLIMVRAGSKRDPAADKALFYQIEKLGVGGVCFFQGDPTRQVELTNTIQQKAKYPVLVAIDGEWGLGMRFSDKAMSYPRQLMLGAIQDNNLLYDMGKDVARQMRAMGIHVNFAPVVDVNNNPNNPVINDRSFGENKYNVAAKSFAYMKGMQDGGLMACAKHFPGHGDTEVDSHLGLPKLSFTRARLDSVELMPFRSMIENGIGSVMVAHLHIPALDDRPNRPTTLSKAAVQGILRDEMGFVGLVFTDAMEMKGVADHFPNGISDAEALVAGNDVILLPNDVEKTIATIEQYIKEGKLTEDRIDQSVRRVLLAKYQVGLDRGVSLLPTNGLDHAINSPSSEAIKSRLIEESLTLIRDAESELPLKVGTDHRYAVVSLGATSVTPFQTQFKEYATCRLIHHPKTISATQQKVLLEELLQHQHVVVALHDMSAMKRKDFGLTDDQLTFLRKLNEKRSYTLVVFGTPYALESLDIKHTAVIAYNEDDLTQKITAQSLFGANPIRGKLPVSAGVYGYGYGQYMAENGTLGYSIPERVGLSSDKLLKIDTIMQEMQDRKAAPGGQVFVAKDGKIVWQKAYGFHTYGKKVKVTNDHIYDLASITKVAATTIALMKLYDSGRLDLRSPLRRYYAPIDTTDKRDMVIEDILAHQARLPGWIPFYKRTLTDDRKPLPELYKDRLTTEHTIPVANKMFLRSDYQDSIYHRIHTCELRDDDSYKYSDLGYYMLFKAVEQLTGMPFDHYLRSSFYNPLGLHTMCFDPLRTQLTQVIAPTEEDRYFRYQRLQGHVHDMGAAMLGGVAGHAGLFANATDVGILMQMLLNDGQYGGTQFLQPSTVKRFTTRYYRSTRRGLGFDMKELDDTRTLNMCEEASVETFGHLGFTGTATFADPKHDIVYVFLSNRTYPSMDNNLLHKLDIRPRIQSAIYQAMTPQT